MERNETERNFCGINHFIFLFCDRMHRNPNGSAE